MTERKKLKLPDVGKPLAPPAPLVRRAGRTDDGRDVTKPIASDADGNPLYAPRGHVFRLPEPS